ncbi:unnamed protein product [Camellia sinensis]
MSLERSSSCESLRSDLLPYVWRCPRGWSVFGECMDPRCEIEEDLVGDDLWVSSAVGVVLWRLAAA